MTEEKKDDFETGGEEVEASWMKFTKVGDYIKGTLLGSKEQPSNNPKFPDQIIYEIKASAVVIDGKAEAVGTFSMGISVKKTGTTSRLNRCKVGQIIGVKFSEEIPAKEAGFAATKQLQVKSWGDDPNYQSFDENEAVQGDGTEGVAGGQDTPVDNIPL